MLPNAVVSASAEEYEVDGEIVQTLFNPDGGVQGEKESKFAVFVKDRCWLIQTTDHDKAGKSLMARETACTNGTEIYEVEGPPNNGQVSGKCQFSLLQLFDNNGVSRQTAMAVARHTGSSAIPISILIHFGTPQHPKFPAGKRGNLKARA